MTDNLGKKDLDIEYVGYGHDENPDEYDRKVKEKWRTHRCIHNLLISKMVLVRKDLQDLR